MRQITCLAVACVAIVSFAWLSIAHADPVARGGRFAGSGVSRSASCTDASGNTATCGAAR